MDSCCKLGLTTSPIHKFCIELLSLLHNVIHVPERVGYKNKKKPLWIIVDDILSNNLSL